MAEQNQDHIVKVPTWYKFLIGGEILLAIVVLGLAAYGATFNDWFGGDGFAIFCAIAILLTHGYYLLSTIFFPAAYNCWVLLILFVFQVIWWLSCWASLAAWAATYNISIGGMSIGDAVDQVLNCKVDDYGNLVDCPSEGDRKSHRNAMAAAAGIAALNWVLIIVSLVVFSLALHHHRTSGAPYTNSGMWRTTPQNPRGIPNNTGNVEAGVVQEGKGPMQQNAPVQNYQQSYQMYPQGELQAQQPQQNY
ncbi:hypothetical protein BCR34DRAFT_604554 [Clohesyomyces aquaticus]|uniref:MARVEL domain-containing protein n=1 Tax=Clohesyomyces aquaticus TaxID=1231657 RepID=A0A1Y1Z4Y4_9PLEO|nr:hypothetical protein BCR34DRAFT_604554 [Clohesyomyces aquaticus]